MRISINPIGAANVAESAATAGIPLAKELVDAFAYQNVEILTADQVTETSIMGSPIFMSLTIDDFQWDETKIVDGVSSKTTHKVPSFKLPCVIVEVSFEKKIIETFVQRQKMASSFKEHIVFGDYAVTIKGILSDGTDKYPLSLLNFLNQICQAPVAIPVGHTIMNKLGIYYIVIKGGSPVLDQGGRQNLQPFTLHCISDDDRSLTITTPQ